MIIDANQLITKDEYGELHSVRGDEYTEAGELLRTQAKRIFYWKRKGRGNAYPILDITGLEGEGWKRDTELRNAQ